MCFVARPRELKVFSVLFFSGWFLIGDKVFANVPPRVGLPIVVFVFPFFFVYYFVDENDVLGNV